APNLGFFQHDILEQLASDNWSYAPCLALAPLLAAGLAWSARRAGRLVWAAAACVILAWSGLSWRQARVWQSTEAVLRQTAQAQPAVADVSVPLLLYLLGQGRYADAVAQGQAAVS